MKRKHIVNIKKIAFTKLRKLEVCTFYNEVVAIISRHDIKAMQIEATCHVLIEMQAKAELLELSDRDLGPHLLTPIVTELHERRLKFAGLITNHMRVVEQAAFKGTDQLVKIAKEVVLRYLNYLRQNNRVDVTQIIFQFFGELEVKPEVKDALHELGFKPYLDELQDAHDAYMITYDERRVHQSSQHKGSTLSLQREIQNILGILFEQVDHYQHVFSDVDYSNFIAELNNVITSYTKLIKTRETQRQNKKFKAQEDAKASWEEINKKENIEKNQTALDSETTIAKKTKEDIDSPKSTSPETLSKTEGNEKPINGLLDILKKQDKGKKEDNDEQ